MRNFLCYVVFSGLLVSLVATGSEPPALSVSVCELAKNALVYDGKLVQASGIVEYGYHSESLIDEQCPKTSVALGMTNEVKKHEDVAKLQDPIFKARPLGTRALKITATVTGIFRKDSAEDPRRFDPRTIDIQSVANIKVEQWDPKRPKPWRDFGPPPSD